MNQYGYVIQFWYIWWGHLVHSPSPGKDSGDQGLRCFGASLWLHSGTHKIRCFVVLGYKRTSLGLFLEDNIKASKIHQNHYFQVFLARSRFGDPSTMIFVTSCRFRSTSFRSVSFPLMDATLYSTVPEGEKPSSSSPG